MSFVRRLIILPMRLGVYFFFCSNHTNTAHQQEKHILDEQGMAVYRLCRRISSLRTRVPYPLIVTSHRLVSTMPEMWSAAAWRGTDHSLHSITLSSKNLKTKRDRSQSIQYIQRAAWKNPTYPNKQWEFALRLANGLVRAAGRVCQTVVCSITLALVG